MKRWKLERQSSPANRAAPCSEPRDRIWKMLSLRCASLNSSLGPGSAFKLSGLPVMNPCLFRSSNGSSDQVKDRFGRSHRTPNHTSGDDSVVCQTKTSPESQRYRGRQVQSCGQASRSQFRCRRNRSRAPRGGSGRVKHGPDRQTESDQPPYFGPETWKKKISKKRLKRK